MEFGLAVTIDSEIENKSVIIRLLSDELTDYFKEKEYGGDVKAYTIGVLCTNPPPGFEKFAKVPKPSYTKGKKTIAPDGIPFTLEDSLEYSIKPDYETFKNADETESRKILAKEILQSLSILDDMKKKIKEFNSDQFKEDITNFFRERKLI